MAFSIGDHWKVGQAKFDNGVVILIKPKSGNERERYLSLSGYGLEGLYPSNLQKDSRKRDDSGVRSTTRGEV